MVRHTFWPCVPERKTHTIHSLHWPAGPLERAGATAETVRLVEFGDALRIR